jgi:hypothetical protein
MIAGVVALLSPRRNPRLQSKRPINPRSQELMTAHDIEQQARWEKPYSLTCAVLLGLFRPKLDDPRISSDTLRGE